MTRMPFTEDTLEDNQVTGGEHEFGLGHIEFEVPMDHPRKTVKEEGFKGLGL